MLLTKHSNSMPFNRLLIGDRFRFVEGGDSYLKASASDVFNIKDGKKTAILDYKVMVYPE